MNNSSKAYLIVLLIISIMGSINSQTLDEIKDQIINEWKSIALELVPFAQGNKVFPQYQRREWNFTADSEFSMKIEGFSDKSGSRLRTFQGSGIITFQGESNVIQGAYLCQFHLNKTLILTLHTDDEVKYFNEIETGGITWIKDKPQDITLLSVPAFNKLAGQYFIAYDLLYIRDNYLYMGEVDALGNEPSADTPPRGLCKPMIPSSDDITPLTQEELKQEIVKGVWSSIAKEIRPQQNNLGGVDTVFLTRQFTFPDETSFTLIVSFYPGPGQTESYMDLEMIGKIEWEEDASAVVAGAQWTLFIVNQLYITPKSEQTASNFNQNLPQGLEPFELNKKANLTEKDFPAFGLSKDSQVKESDLLYLRENRLYFGARPVDGSRPYPTVNRTYALSDCLIDPERSASFSYIIMLNILIFSLLI